MTYRLGLTGSIGMGKSTTAAMLAAEGCPVWDADATVHRLYATGGAAVPAVEALAPGAVQEGAVDRPALRALIEADPTLLKRIEAAVHPLVAADRAAFLAELAPDVAVAVLDVPLLYETGTDALCDGVAVVSAPPEVQLARVLARPGMDAEAAALLIGRQMPDAEKRARARWVIPTLTLDGARATVRQILSEIRAEIRGGT